jgi:hypothetical protein
VQLNELTTEVIHKELDLIQSCINRMANSSFMIKGWMITLVAALVALLADKASVCVIAGLAVAIILSFWYLDAFFLRAERLFRLKYEWVIEERPKGNTEHLYDLNPANRFMWKRQEVGEKDIFSMMFSLTLIPFYALPLFVAVASVVWTQIFTCPIPPSVTP